MHKRNEEESTGFMIEGRVKDKHYKMAVTSTMMDGLETLGLKDGIRNE